MKKTFRLLIGLVLLLGIIYTLFGCAKEIKSEELTKKITTQKVLERPVDENFANSHIKFTLDIFKESVKSSQDKNMLVSPLSILLALAMTANGADAKTKAEMENVLGGGLTIEELNEYLHTYVNSLPSGNKYKLEIANSIWYRNTGIDVNKDFLQTNANYYNAEMYKSKFDQTTVDDMNTWVDKNTDGMIKKIIDDIGPLDVMFLMNAIVFDSEWEVPFVPDRVKDGIFNSIKGEAQPATMMSSNESIYIKDGSAQGFIRLYKDNKYSFAALLPNEGVNIYDYVNSLTIESLTNTLNNQMKEKVVATTPKFTYEYDIMLNNILINLGMADAFNPGAADFSKMGSSSYGNIYIGSVLHKTFISLDEKGTKAAAVTKVGMVGTSYQKEIYINLNRPFVYMILDNQTNLPIFIGVLVEVWKGNLS